MPIAVQNDRHLMSIITIDMDIMYSLEHTCEAQDKEPWRD